MTQDGFDMVRLFVALWPGPVAREKLDACRNSWVLGGSKLVSADDLHLTLHFIGPLDRALAGDLAEALVVPVSAFEICFGYFEMWPHGTAVLRPDAESESLRELHALLGNALQRFGIPLEGKPFRPHVTLARRAFVRAPEHSPPKVHWHVDGYALVESQPHRKPHYSVLHSYR